MPLPIPEPGLVISYAYLWHNEHLAGLEEGRKSRPAVIILAVKRPETGSVVVTVVPITHTKPRDSREAVEIPLALKRHLHLDDAPSWVVVAEGNEFIWPGYDLVKISGSERYDYGFVPPRFFTRLIESFVAYHRSGKKHLTPRK
jgi:hypothetical protein